eukprot:1180507-Prorocentrum_minimum.AAC.1
MLKWVKRVVAFVQVRKVEKETGWTLQCADDDAAKDASAIVQPLRTFDAEVSRRPPPAPEALSVPLPSLVLVVVVVVAKVRRVVQRGGLAILTSIPPRVSGATHLLEVHRQRVVGVILGHIVHPHHRREVGAVRG